MAIKKSKLITRMQLACLTGGSIGGRKNPLGLGSPISYVGGSAFATFRDKVHHVCIKEDCNRPHPNSPHEEFLVYRMMKHPGRLPRDIQLLMQAEVRKSHPSIAIFWEPNSQKGRSKKVSGNSKGVCYLGHWKCVEVETYPDKPKNLYGSDRCATVHFKFDYFDECWEKIIEFCYDKQVDEIKKLDFEKIEGLKLCQSSSDFEMKAELKRLFIAQNEANASKRRDYSTANAKPSSAEILQTPLQEILEVVDNLFHSSDKDAVTVGDIVRSVAKRFNMSKQVKKSLKPTIKARLADLIIGDGGSNHGEADEEGFALKNNEKSKKGKTKLDAASRGNILSNDEDSEFQGEDSESSDSDYCDEGPLRPFKHRKGKRSFGKVSNNSQGKIPTHSVKHRKRGRAKVKPTLPQPCDENKDHLQEEKSTRPNDQIEIERGLDENNNLRVSDPEKQSSDERSPAAQPQQQIPPQHLPELEGTNGCSQPCDINSPCDPSLSVARSLEESSPQPEMQADLRNSSEENSNSRVSGGEEKSSKEGSPNAQPPQLIPAQPIQPQTHPEQEGNDDEKCSVPRVTIKQEYDEDAVVVVQPIRTGFVYFKIGCEQLGNDSMKKFVRVPWSEDNISFADLRCAINEQITLPFDSFDFEVCGHYLDLKQEHWRVDEWYFGYDNCDGTFCKPHPVFIRPTPSEPAKVV